MRGFRCPAPLPASHSVEIMGVRCSNPRAAPVLLSVLMLLGTQNADFVRDLRPDFFLGHHLRSAVALKTG